MAEERPGCLSGTRPSPCPLLRTHLPSDKQEARYPKRENEAPADSAVHDAHVVKGFADGQVAVIRQHSQEEKFCSSKKDNKKDLAEAGIDGDHFVPT